MQTPKTSVKSSSGSEGARRISPRSVSLETKQRSTGRVVRQLKTSGPEAHSSTSARTPKATSAKILDRTSPRGLDPEKKRPGRVAELETQINQLEDALRTVKDQLIVSESWKKQAKLDAEESRKELSDITLRLEESQKLLATSSSIEPNSNYLSAYEEIRVLKENLAEKHSIMEEMKNELEDSRSSESQAHALASETLQQLETAKKTMESLKLTSDEYNAIASELDQSKARVSSLESIIEEIRAKEKEDESEEIIALKSELENLKSRQTLEINEEYNAIVSELDQSRARVSSLESIIEEIRAKGREIESEEIIALKSELESLKSRRTFEINDELRKSKEDIEELRSNLLDKETELQCVVGENEDLNAKLANLGKIDFENLKSKLTSLEAELSKKCDENEALKLEVKRMKSSNDEVADVNERLEVVKMSNCEMEEELRRLKVQMSQWRKAAEAATDMLCDENGDSNGRMVEERAWSMGRFSPRKRMNMGLPGSVGIDEDEDEDDEFLKRKDGNMLRRIGVLWRRPLNK